MHGCGGHGSLAQVSTPKRATAWRKPKCWARQAPTASVAMVRYLLGTLLSTRCRATPNNTPDSRDRQSYIHFVSPRIPATLISTTTAISFHGETVSRCSRNDLTQCPLCPLLPRTRPSIVPSPPGHCGASLIDTFSLESAMPKPDKRRVMVEDKLSRPRMIATRELVAVAVARYLS